MDKLIEKAFDDLIYMIEELRKSYKEEEDIIGKSLILNPADNRMLYGAQCNIAILYENLQYYKTLREKSEEEKDVVKQYIENEQDKLENGAKEVSHLYG